MGDFDRPRGVVDPVDGLGDFARVVVPSTAFPHDDFAAFFAAALSSPRAPYDVTLPTASAFLASALCITFPASLSARSKNPP